MSQIRARYRIILLGYIVRGPLGGLVWHHLQYVLGLSIMGHEVLFVETSGDDPSCYNPLLNTMSSDPAYGLQFISTIFEKHGLADNWAFHHVPENTWYGKPFQHVKEFCKSADLLINLSGVNPVEEYALQIPLRALVDTDPVFTQVRNLNSSTTMQLSARHTHFFSFAENIGRKGCLVPVDGLAWMPSRQPVVLDEWKFTTGNTKAPWTTVMQWDSYQTREFGGIRYGMKSGSFQPFLQLPLRSTEIFELALGGEAALKTELKEHGWRLADPLFVTRSPKSYQEYIRQSKAEWSVAKHGYVVSNSGWFSERSTCYLASGRPVLVQDTGFSAVLETGKGVLQFNNMEQCLAGIDAIQSQYEKHCHWAREFAYAYFDHRTVLNSLLHRLG